MSMLSQSSVAVAVCDDEIEDLNTIVSKTKEILETEGISYHIARFLDPVSLQNAIENGEKFQVLLLDVMMGRLNGIDLAAALQRQGNEAAIVFISSNREMALFGYEVSAVRYLAKPVQTEKLREALLYCCEKCLIQKEILLPTSEGQRRISLADIIYIEPWERGTHLILRDGDCKAAVKISDLEHMLPGDSFVFCHRTLLVNLGFIRSIRYCELTLKNGQTLPVSKYRQSQVKESFLHYLRC